MRRKIEAVDRFVLVGRALLPEQTDEGADFVALPLAELWVESVHEKVAEKKLIAGHVE